MRIPTVEKFLCCFKLESGATVLGWITAVCATLAFLIWMMVFGFAVMDYPSFVNVTASTMGVEPEMMQNSRLGA